MDLADISSASTRVLAQGGDVVSPGETAVFWVLGPLALLGAIALVFAKNAVHSALWLVVTMLSLGVLYMAQSAQFLGFTQIIVYTGAIMMLFLFVLMMVGRDASDSVVEVLRGQRVWAGIGGIGLAVLLVSGLARAVVNVRAAPPLDPWSPAGGGAGGLGRVIFTEYLFPFELTSALLITAAVGAMVLAYGGKGKRPRTSQKHWVHERLRHGRPSPLPGPGVYATANSVATPALLPDGSVAPDSLSEILRSVPVQDLVTGTGAGPGAYPDAHALTGAEPPRPDVEPGTGAAPEPRNGHDQDHAANGRTAPNVGEANSGGTGAGDPTAGAASAGDPTVDTGEPPEPHASGKSGERGVSGSRSEPGDQQSGHTSSEEVRR